MGKDKYLCVYKRGFGSYVYVEKPELSDKVFCNFIMSYPFGRNDFGSEIVLVSGLEGYPEYSPYHIVDKKYEFLKHVLEIFKLD